MASFSTLPNEMIREIASHVMPEDLENFSLVSKRIYAINLPFLEEHRELRKRYSAFDNSGKAEFDGPRLQISEMTEDYDALNCCVGETFPALLTDVLMSPRIAPYIKEIRLQGWSFGWDDDQHDYIRVPYTEEQVILFKQALSTYVLPTKLDTWIEGLESGDESVIIGLLLILLPNITSIKYEFCDNVGSYLQGVIERIEAECIPGIAILSHLERVNLQYNDAWTEDDPRSIDFLAFLATIPSLKSLYGKAINSCCGAYDLSCVRPRSSNITDLGFKMCNISLEHLENLLRGLKALQEFHYIYDKYSESLNMEPWDPAGMCELLLQYAQRSLEVLDLRSRNKPIGPIKSLKGFEILREISLSFQSFRVGAGFSLRTLASKLPRSIQSISIHDIELKDVPFVYFTICEVREIKPNRLPRLESLYLWTSWACGDDISIPNSLWKWCEDEGFKVHMQEE